MKLKLKPIIFHFINDSILTIFILYEFADEQKNLVYVLLKKAEASSDIKIRKPQNKRPQKPEVYFIRYKGQEQEQGGYQQAPPSNGGYQQAPPSRSPAPTYGAPF